MSLAVFGCWELRNDWEQLFKVIEDKGGHWVKSAKFVSENFFLHQFLNHFVLAIFEQEIGQNEKSS